MSSGRIGALIIVLDGLRPDMVTADVMPCLAAFRARATTFANARSVFPSVTPAAAASMATGTLPSRHGVLGSHLYRNDVAPDRILDLRDHRIVRGLDQHLAGGLLTAPTFADVLATAGLRMAIVDAGQPVASTLLNPRAGRHKHWTFSTDGRTATPTPSAWDEVVGRLGFPPERDLPRFEEVRFAVDVMIEHILASAPPAVAALWLSEPDATSRYREIGSLATESALRHVDRQVGRLLREVDRRQGLDRTLVIIASDHGQITARGEIDVPFQMRLAGMTCGSCDRLAGAGLAFAGSGYGTLTRTAAGDERHVSQAASWLLEQAWVGHVFTRGGGGLEGDTAGSLSLQLAGLKSVHGPDVVFTFASNCNLDPHGMPGCGLHSSAGGGSIGTHGGLNPFEMNVVLMIAGPGFEGGKVSLAPAGIIDLAPTVLAQLDLSFPVAVAGRDLARSSRVAVRGVRIEVGTDKRKRALLICETGQRGLEMDDVQYPINLASFSSGFAPH